ncbi:MAG: trehalose-phosphatase [Candidatus Binatia bacterium]|nr:trehalose-phosphatase [Candidatus Binatia bacterium]
MSELLAGQPREQLLTHLAEARGLFCFVDYDGTLAPIAPRPELALPEAGATQVVQALAALPKVHLAIVSGRRADEVRQLLPASGAYYVGVHGAEVVDPTGEKLFLEEPSQIQHWLERARELLEPAIKNSEGVWIEDKIFALACHTRLASENSRHRAERAVRSVYERLRLEGAPLQLVEGKRVLEFRSKHVNKGRAVLWLWQSRAPDFVPLYAGDDATDEDAFSALAGQGVTIRVGAESVVTRAHYRIATPKDLVAFLRDLWFARKARPSS